MSPTHRLQLNSPVSAAAGWFGYSVAIDGTRMPIGVPVGGTGNCGSACEYMSSGGTWVTREQRRHSERHATERESDT